MRTSKKIWLLIFIFLAVFSFCMLIVFEVPGAEIHGNVQFGYIVELNAFETEINVQYLPRHWFALYGGVDILAKYYEEAKFRPNRTAYITGVKVNITENLYVDLYHHCVHVVIYDYNEQFFYDEFEDGDKTMISVGIGW